MMLKPLMNKYESFIVTEKTDYSVAKNSKKIYYLNQVNRNEKTFIYKMILNSFNTVRIFLKEKPDVIISTGALATIPMCLLAKIFKRKLIFIESFAKVNSPTLTGRLLSRFADQFYVQWKDMLKVYPYAIYKGGIY
ncbi:polysaccharide biosynthesis protein [Clostridium chromiireducens]|nr:polysaccharide biosynthesis protein [Clostridium chromiireducens]RII34613.1 polysaccharide biosynthesis protein [Clostridium chromiireducens]